MAKKTKKSQKPVEMQPSQSVPTVSPVDTALAAPSPQAPLSAVHAAQTEKPATVERSNIKASKSTVEKPTKAVWAIADEMKAKNPQVTRKEIVDECIRRGIAFYTARTQYQRWAKSKKPTTRQAK